jgi:hypothetical protein
MSSAAASASSARVAPEPLAMSPEEEMWLEEQLELQLVEAGLSDMPCDLGASCAASELTAGEQAEFDAWIESQARRVSQESDSGTASVSSL